MTNQWTHYSANLRKICNIIGPKTWDIMKKLICSQYLDWQFLLSLNILIFCCCRKEKPLFPPSIVVLHVWKLVKFPMTNCLVSACALTILVTSLVVYWWLNNDPNIPIHFVITTLKWEWTLIKWSNSISEVTVSYLYLFYWHLINLSTLTGPPFIDCTTTHQEVGLF